MSYSPIKLERITPNSSLCVLNIPIESLLVIPASVWKTWQIFLNLRFRPVQFIQQFAYLAEISAKFSVLVPVHPIFPCTNPPGEYIPIPPTQSTWDWMGWEWGWAEASMENLADISERSAK